MTLPVWVRSIPPALLDGFHELFHPPGANIPALDVLRSAAILLVFTGHYVLGFRASATVQNFPLFRWGWTGVDLFFVLSGFLIGSQLWKELSRTGQILIGHFLLRRGLRIWPLYYGFVAFALMEHFSKGIWPDVAFLSNFFHSQVSGGWSLSTEEQFYILTPLLLSLFAMKLAPRRLWIVPVLALAALVSARAFVMAHSTLPEHLLREKLYFPIFTHADGLAIGVLLAWFSVFHKARLRSKIFSTILIIAMLIGGLLLYTSSAVLWNFTALGLIYGSMALYGISTLPLPQLVRWRGFYLLSRLSYGFYLNHFGIISLLYPKLYGWSTRGSVNFWCAYSLCLAICLLVAILTFSLIEWPFLRVRANWLDRSRLAVAGQTSMGSA
jgi:peptidoglycan/LPS O-acetylase OafA/YrhL